MRLLSTLLCSMTVLWFAACGPSNESSPTKPLTFQQHVFTDQGGTCVKEDDPCAKISVQYVSAEGTNAKKINTVLDTIYVRMADVDWEGAQPSKTLQEVAAFFKKSFEEQRKEFPDAPYGWEVDVKTEVLQTQPVASISITSYTFTGGAHPNTVTRLLNFNPQGQYIDPQSHITNTKKFQSVLESAFRKAREIPEGQPWKEAGLFDDQLTLPNEMAFTKEGLKIFYNPYEIMPYAAGPTEFTIPYAQLEGIMQLTDAK
ncbi:MAG: DUF3298 and DUF4163 domain-containing protein [Bacteroidetes Order II. Incertae sedis bacterium]|nr:DUF3298 and DUF4163 domain-containing protein [Bacteroidetes Order II. bacterium]